MSEFHLKPLHHRIDKIKVRHLENQLSVEFWNFETMVINYKNMKRIYHFDYDDKIYTIVEIKLKTIFTKISKNIKETTFRTFRKHFEYYKN